jgi:hypothetical protein
MLEISMRSSRTDHLHSEVTEPKALAMVANVDMVIAIWRFGQTLMDLAVMAVTATLQRLQLQAES